MCDVQVGMTDGQRTDFDAFLGAIPCVSVDAFCETEVRGLSRHGRIRARVTQLASAG
jgi:hypothetical protein